MVQQVWKNATKQTKSISQRENELIVSSMLLQRNISSAYNTRIY